MNRQKSKELFEKAIKLIPGGVNSPVRAFKAVGGDPIFIKSAKGAYMYDHDGNSYIDLINSWGPMILGHAKDIVTEAVSKALENSFSFGAPSGKEVEMAELIVSMVPSIEKVRMVNSGTEATMSAIRLARGYTKRNKILKFEGCYHGHGDSFLISAGSGAITMGSPDSLGVTQGVANDTLTSPFNDIESVINLFTANKNEIACVIVEPVVGNMGCVLPKNNFLAQLREICNREGAILIFDEVMTGFRLSKGGAQELYGVMPDLTTMGKIIGGGMPVGAYGGKKEIMDLISPSGPVYQAGTLSGNPIAMTAGLTMLHYLNNHIDVYHKIDTTTEYICKGIEKNCTKLEIPFQINRIGSMFSLFFTDTEVNNLDDAKQSDLKIFSQYFNNMLKHGIYLAPSQFESLFVSTAISRIEADLIIEANYFSIKEIIDSK